MQAAQIVVRTLACRGEIASIRDDRAYLATCGPYSGRGNLGYASQLIGQHAPDAAAAAAHALASRYIAQSRRVLGIALEGEHTRIEVGKTFECLSAAVALR